MSTRGTEVDSNIRATRLELRRDIEAHLRIVADLREQLNDLAPIARLLPELLSDIFVHVADAAHDRLLKFLGSEHRYYWMSPWVVLSAVCRRFRSTALGTPRFWSFIYSTPRSSTPDTFLTRSKNAPLYVAAYIDTRSGHTHISRIMSPAYSKRIRELFINGPQQSIRTFLAKHASQLGSIQELVLETMEGGGPGSDAYGPGAPSVLEPFSSSAGLPPQLRKLELKQLPFRWNELAALSSSTAGITSLILVPAVVYRSSVFRSVKRIPIPGTPDQFLVALKMISPRLEHLRLEYTLPRAAAATGIDTATQSCSASINFPVLKTLDLSDDTVNVAYVFRRLTIPSSAAVTVTAHRKAGIKGLMCGLSAHFTKDVPLSGHKFISICLTPDLAGTGFEEVEICLQRSEDETSSGTLRLTLVVTNGRDALQQALRHAGTLFTSVESLSIDLKEYRWNKLFRRFPRIERLVQTFIPSSLLRYLTIPDGRCALRLPRLSAVTFKLVDLRARSGWLCSGDADYEPLKLLLDWAILRCNHSLPLEKLAFVDCLDADVDVVERLKEVVGSVEVRYDR
ncbi:hypothetical protein C8Q77DRAFT_197811 [Trametes polyzona]|nr:hypothetical protein C8Q77DRAFT_197811 [Trametes polyzona]